MPRPERLTIGMAVYEDFDGVYFTIQALRAYHKDIDPSRVEFLVIDNCPNGQHAETIKDFVDKHVPNGRYVSCEDIKGTAVRNFIFEKANTELVLCLDSHVLLEPGVLKQLFEYYDMHLDSNDLLQGPLVYDDMMHIATHFEPKWNGGMFGVWGTDRRGYGAEPFDIPSQGLGLFSCRKRAWLGFNPRFSGFGGEEGYIHEKFRQAGRRTLCLPFLRWIHRFGRPGGPPYRNTWEDRIRNYLLGRQELGLPVDDVIEHFESILGKPIVAAVATALAQEK